MKWFKACLNNKATEALVVVSVVTVALVGVSMAASGGGGSSRGRDLTVYTSNNTNKSWNASECVNSQCTSFPLSARGFQTSMIPEPSTGSATLTGIFTSSGTFNPVQCSKTYNVNVSTVALVTLSQSSATYTCSINIP